MYKRDVIVDCYRWIAGSDRNFINQKEGVTDGENYFFARVDSRLIHVRS